MTARRVASTVIIALWAAACSGESTGGSPAAPPAVARVELARAFDTVFVGDTLRLTAQLRDASGAALAGRPITWTSADPAVGSVDGAGTVVGLAPGQSVLTATSEGRQASVVVTVLPQPVARVVFAEPALARDIGERATAVVRLLDRRGSELTGRRITFGSTAADIARVDSLSGAIVALQPGTTTIVATSEGTTGTMAFTVRPPPPVARLGFGIDALALEEGATATVEAIAYDSLGRVLAGRAVAYASSAPAVAAIDRDATGVGRVRGVAPGAATLSASSEGRSATLAVTVRPEPVASVSIVGTATRAATVGDTLTVAVAAFGTSGRRLVDRVPSFTSANAAVATVDAASGLVRVVGSGTTTVTATVEERSVVVTLTAAPGTVTRLVVTPAGITAAVGGATPIAVRGIDRDGWLVSVPAATFVSSSPATADVGLAGGAVRGVGAGTTSVTATLGALRTTVPVQVTATGAAAARFTFELRFTTNVGFIIESLTRQAAARFERALRRGLVPTRVDLAAGECFAGLPAVHETVTNVLVFVRIVSIDGPYRSLAVGGPCEVRESGMPVVGMVSLDSADVARYNAGGNINELQSLILHELGHVLGIGTTTGFTGLAPDARTSADARFFGPAAARASTAAGFTAAATGVPVEVGAGHWRESVFGEELMTPSFTWGQPLSAITLGALQDLGYDVDLSAADPFARASADVVPNPPRELRRSQEPFEELVYPRRRGHGDTPPAASVRR